MSRPKGSKNRSSQESVDSIIPDTGAASEEATNNTALGYVGDAVLDPEREQIINQYNEENNLTEPAPAEAEKTEEAKAEDTVVDEKKEEVAVAPPEEEAAPVAEVTDALKEEKKKEEIKTVPYDALHEEREKRKIAQSKARELEEKIKELEAKVNNKPPADDTYLTDEEKKLRDVEEEISRLKAKEAAREKETYQAQERSAREQLDKNLADTDKALADEGYPGFQFLTSRISEELNKLVQEDPDNAYLDSPEGWKKIYKEKVFPAVKGIFTQADKQSLMDEKKAAKTGAGLAGSPGKSDKAPEKKADDGLSIDEYLEMRRKGSL